MEPNKTNVKGLLLRLYIVVAGFLTALILLGFISSSGYKKTYYSSYTTTDTKMMQKRDALVQQRDEYQSQIRALKEANLSATVYEQIQNGNKIMNYESLITDINNEIFTLNVTGTNFKTSKRVIVDQTAIIEVGATILMIWAIPFGFYLIINWILKGLKA